MPYWTTLLIAFLAGSAPLLALALYSVRAQRSTRVPVCAEESLDELLGSIEGLTTAWFTDGNELELLENGGGFFPRLFADIEAARDHVHLETYVWWRGEVCEQAAELLATKALAGVEVRLVLDYVGSWTMDRDLARRLLETGVRIEKFNALTLRTFARLNKRTHRKLAVIDGKVGYVFGHGFAREWQGAGDRASAWRDVGARLRGPIVSRIQSAFAQHWMEESGEVLANSRYFPKQDPCGDVRCQLVTSSPRGGVSSVAVLLRLMIAIAREELLITNPYCAPADDLARHLISAAGRGVRVRLLVPGEVTDSRISQYAGRHRYERLMKAKIEILRHRVTLPHQKVIVVDGRWSHIGSANLDERSFDINAESCLTIFDRGVAERLRGTFRRDAERSECLDLETWRRRPWTEQVIEKLACAFRQQL